jgi:hypothetical protein
MLKITKSKKLWGSIKNEPSIFVKSLIQVFSSHTMGFRNKKWKWEKKLHISFAFRAPYFKIYLNTIKKHAIFSWYHKVSSLPFLYRKYVLHSLRKLRFLDCYEITDYEKDMVQKEATFFDVITYKENSSASSSKSGGLERYENWTPLPASKKTEFESEAQAKSSFGYSKYVYHGKQSEGNRFIRNDDL